MEPSNQLPTISAQRVNLRWVTEQDAEALFAVFSSPQVTRYWSWPAYVEVDQARKLVDQIHRCFEEQTLFQWGVARKEDDVVIGTCTLASIDRTHKRAEIGFALGNESWGEGYMSEAITALLEDSFPRMDLHRIEADVDPRNLSSIRLLERMGFQKEGYLRERWHVDGEIQDALYYGLLRREWEGR